MPYIIDGHNLIPHLGLNLKAIDDEEQLIKKLQTFCRLHRCKAEVFFDKAPAGHSGKRRCGQVTAHFISAHKTADDAISNRLNQLKKAARNWTVVTSDRMVQAEAHSFQAKVISSKEFSQKYYRLLSQHDQISDDELNPTIDDNEIDEWLRLFGEQ